MQIQRIISGYRRSLAALLGLVVIGSGTAQSAEVLLRQIDNPFPSVADNFGRNISVTHNGLILCGAAGSEVDTEGFSNSGIAYLINGMTGAVEVTMFNPEPDTNVGFGAFAWSGQTKVVVSAVGKNDGMSTESGRAYIFNMSDGQFLHTIPNPTPAAGERFGYGLGMLGDTAVIGCPGDDSSSVDSGTVYLYNTNTGALEKTIPNPDPTIQDGFGYTVAGLNGGLLAIGAPAYDTTSTDAGAVFIMDSQSGTVLHKIVNPDPVVSGYFGFQVRTHGDDILVGAPGNNKAYLYDVQTGQMILRFENPDVKPEAFFGSSVGSVGQHILVGNPLEPYDARWIGRAYLFDGNSGELLETFDNPEPEAEDRFGVSVAGLNGDIVISCDQNRVNGVLYAGSLYVYKGPRSAACCSWNLYE